MTYASRYYNIKYEHFILDQGPYGSCVPCALVSQLYEMMKEAGHPIPLLSRMQSYYDTRVSQNTVYEDSGSIAGVTLFNAQYLGIAPEYVWDYTPEHMYNKAPQWVYDMFSTEYKLGTFYYLNVTKTSEEIRDNVLEYLSQGKQILTSFKLRPYFDEQDEPLAQQIGHGDGVSRGGHAVSIVGWDASIDGGSYIYKGSWGTGVGDNGYGVISYKQFGSNALYGDADLLAMQVVTGLKVGGKLYDFDWSPARTEAQEQYVSVLGRSADILGLDWHVANNLHAIVHTEIFAQMLIDSAEGQALYANKTNTEYVDVMYMNILGRHGEQAGINYWAGILQQGYTRGFVAANMLEAVKQPGGEQHEMFENKLNFANYVSITKMYDGSFNTDVKALMSQITADDNQLEIIKIGVPDEWSM